MRNLDLPVFPGDMELSDVLARLHELRRSAAVTFVGDEFRIVTARDIAIARKNKSRQLREVPTREAAVPNDQGYLWLGQTPMVTSTIRLGKHSLQVITPQGKGIEHARAFVGEPGFGSQLWKEVRDAVDVRRSGQPTSSGRGTVVLDDVMSGRYDHPRIDVLMPNLDVGLVYAAAPPDYFCDGTPSHDDFPPPDVREGDPCPRLDGATIVSTR